ncbi:hypothetical protein Pfo_022999 [Paulownia fortunei]|nr:hypothetical protein Pfo_022999 [Paulownia fortunei]
MRNLRMRGYFTLSQLHKPYGMNKMGVLSALSGYRRIQIVNKSTVGRKPKKKVYHRVHELDRVMELQKKPSLILQLKSIIQSQKTESLLLRDLEKIVGFARMQMEPILVRHLRKLLMLSVNCRLPLETTELIASELVLPSDFKNSLILNYPQSFRLNEVNGREHLHLENWDSSLAVTAREERLATQGRMTSSGQSQRAKISKDSNFSGPFTFRLNFPAGFRPNMSYLEEVQRWQKMDVPSPYLNTRRLEAADPKARKRAVAVLHELLSLTMEKRLTSAQLDAFHSEYRLPARLLLCLIKRHGIFYITNKGVQSTVILLKEAYDGSNLIDKCPHLEFRDKFVALMGRRDGISCAGASSSVVNLMFPMRISVLYC